MWTTSLYFRTDPDEALEHFAARLLGEMGVRQTEERHSMEVFGGIYVKGSGPERKFVVMPTDRLQFFDYQFALRVSSFGTSCATKKEHDRLIDDIAKSLAAKGYKLAVSLGPRRDSGRVVYGE